MPHKRQHPDWPTRVYKYGIRPDLRSWDAWPEALRRESLGMRDFWNALCALWDDQERVYRAVLLHVPALAHAWEAVAQAEKDTDGAWDALMLARQRAYRHPEARQAVQDCEDVHAASRQTLRRAWQAFARLRRQHRDVLRAPLKAVADAFHAAQKVAYNAAPLYAPNKGWVLQAFRNTCARRLAGKGGRPRAKLGRLREVHFEYQWRQGGLPADEIFGDGAHFGIVQPPGAARDLTMPQRTRRRLSRTHGRMRLARDLVHHFRLVFHRDLPDKSLVKRVVFLGRERHPQGHYLSESSGCVEVSPDLWDWELHVVVEFPPVAAAVHTAPDARCAMDVGYRILDAVSIRLGVVVDTPGFHQAKAVMFPRAIVRQWLDARAHQGHADGRLEMVKERLACLLASATPGSDIQAMASRMTQMRASGLRRLWRTLKQEPPPWAEWQIDAVKALEMWSVRHDRSTRRLRRAQMRWIRHRRWYYHNLAHVLCRTYSTIVLEDLALKQMQHGGNVPRLKEAAKFRQLVAIGEFFDTLPHVALRYGTSLRFEDPAWTTLECWECGARVPANTGALVLECPNGHQWDQDANASRVLYRRAFSSCESPSRASLRLLDSRLKDARLLD